MPIAKIQLPDGRIAKFEVPEGTTPEQVTEFASKQFSAPNQPEQQPDLSAEFNSLPFYERFAIGAGKGLTDVGRGVGQMFGADLEPKDKAIDDSIGGFFGTTGKIAGSVAASLPAAFIPGANTALGSTLVGAGLGAAFNEGDLGTRAQNAAIGAAGGLIGQQVPHLLDVGRRALAPIFGSQGTKERIAGDMINLATRGESNNPKLLAEALRKGDVQLVPGSQPTAAEVGNSGGLAALQRWASQAMPEDFTFRDASNAAARRSSLERLAGTASDKQNAINRRELLSGGLYEKAKQQSVPVDDTLRELLSRPSMRDALSEAQRIAADKGTPIDPQFIDDVLNGNVKADISGEGLHWLKIGLDAMRKNPQNPIAGERLRALQGIIDEFEGWRGANIPDYAAAQRSYQLLSRPINRMEVGEDLVKRLSPAITDYSNVTRETPNMLAKALRDADLTAQRATGFKGAKWDDVLSPAEQKTVENVVKDVGRKVYAQTEGRGVGSNTFQNFNMNALAEQAGVPTPIKLLASVTPGLSALSNALRSGGNMLYKGADKEIQQILAQALLSPTSTADLIEKSITPTFADKTLKMTQKAAPLLLIGAGNSL